MLISAVTLIIRCLAQVRFAFLSQGLLSNIWFAMSQILLIDTIDFESYPAGGNLNFARQMMSVFGNRMALVGVVTDGTPIGKWTRKTFQGVTYDFFAVGRRKKKATKPLIPARLSCYFWIRRFRKEILSLGVRLAFMQMEETIMAAGHWGWEGLCFRFPGVNNPLSISRYRGANLFAKMFDRFLFPALNRADVILAAANGEAIRAMAQRSHGIIDAARVISFPTRVDTTVFRPDDRAQCRTQLQLPDNATVVVTSGRLHWAKGWHLLLTAFQQFVRMHPESILCFIGDGDDRAKIENCARDLHLDGRVRISGFQPPETVAKYLNAADLFVLGSLAEGWSTVMVEALACGLPIVTSEVSSAREIASDGKNGFVVKNRSADEFSDAMRRALLLEGVREYSLAQSEKFALRHLRRDLERYFPALTK